jgi:hypothetical protein
MAALKSGLGDCGLSGGWAATCRMHPPESMQADAIANALLISQWLSQPRGTDRPDLGIFDNTYFRFYWESLQAIQRISSPDEGGAGFSTLKFVDMDCVFDGGFQGVQAGTGTVIGGGITWETPGDAPSNHAYIHTKR